MNNSLKFWTSAGLVICFTCIALTTALAQVTPPPPTDYERGKTNMPTGSDFKKDSMRPDNTRMDDKKLPQDQKMGTGQNDNMRSDDKKMPQDQKMGTGQNDNMRSDDKKMPQDQKMGTGQNDNMRMDDKKMPQDAKMGTNKNDDMRMSASDVNRMIGGWPEMSKMAAEATIQKYGQPTESTPSMLIWRDNGPWMKTVVTKEETQHDFPKAHKDCLQQTIRYDVPVKFYDDLARYDGSVSYERTKGTFSARCDKEEMNFLALNLAYDIMMGKRTIAGARDFYAQTVTKFMRGEKSTYTSGLMFQSEKTSGDPDKAAPSMMNTKGGMDMKKPAGSN